MSQLINNVGEFEDSKERWREREREKREKEY